MYQGNINIDEARSVSQEIRARGSLSDDGILDFRKYEATRPRILWLLKQEVEDYGLEDRSRGELVGRDWHEYYPRAIINDANNDNLRTSKTWGKMAIASHMLIKDTVRLLWVARMMLPLGTGVKVDMEVGVPNCGTGCCFGRVIHRLERIKLDIVMK